MQATSHVRTHATQTHKADSGSVHIKKYHKLTLDLSQILGSRMQLSSPPAGRILRLAPSETTFTLRAAACPQALVSTYILN
jgi:hypothetical protein